jgi:hypothetical protein
MSSPELAQHKSQVGRRGFDVVLVGFIVAVAVAIALGGSGLL